MLSFISRAGSPETWPSLYQAAENRFFDGFELAAMDDPGRRTGAIYLLGYTVEILLKVGYYRARGITKAADTTKERRDARKWATRLGMAHRPQNDHDLHFWLFLLASVRNSGGDPLNRAFYADLWFHVSRVRQHWGEHVRYTDVQATRDELGETYESVDWIFANRNQLWST